MSYLGVYTSPEGDCFIITELMTCGDLHRVLRSEAEKLTQLDILYMLELVCVPQSYSSGLKMLQQE